MSKNAFHRAKEYYEERNDFIYKNLNNAVYENLNESKQNNKDLMERLSN